MYEFFNHRIALEGCYEYSEQYDFIEKRFVHVILQHLQPAWYFICVNKFIKGNQTIKFLMSYTKW